MRIAMEIKLKVLIGGVNHLVKIAQVFTWHPIWKLDPISHFEEGPIFMVKTKK
jgi:hypothetical protein